MPSIPVPALTLAACLGLSFPTCKAAHHPEVSPGYRLPSSCLKLPSPPARGHLRVTLLETAGPEVWAQAVREHRPRKMRRPVPSVPKAALAPSGPSGDARAESPPLASAWRLSLLPEAGRSQESSQTPSPEPRAGGCLLCPCLLPSCLPYLCSPGQDRA